MSGVQIKPVIDKYGCIEWIFHSEGILKPLMIISDFEFQQIIKKYNEEKREILKMVNELSRENKRGT